MYPKAHIILGAIFATLLYFLFPITILEALIVFSASVLIDVDHYIYYVLKKKDLSLRNAYIWFCSLETIKDKKPIMVLFHTIEFILIIAILSFYFKIFFFILIAMIFHSIFDIIDMSSKHEFFLREYSFLRWLFSNKKRYY